MASLNIKISNPQAFTNIANRVLSLSDRQALLRPVAFDLIALMTDRIHDQGKASDGSKIGEYSSSYLKLREKNKRGPDKKIVVSFTRQLENDWAVIPTQNGYGIGFNNPFNKQKAQWVEQQKGKKIFKLSVQEREESVLSIREQVKKLLSAQ
jgi:hypothetical protein